MTQTAPVEIAATSLPDRFWAKVDVRGPDECWRWTAALNNGYGVFFLDGRLWRAHRLSYEDAIGPIPTGLVIDHLCRVRCCVNPRHIRKRKDGCRECRQCDLARKRADR